MNEIVYTLIGFGICYCYQKFANKDNAIIDTVMNSRESHKMIFIVRMDLKMGKGKIAAQCGHATLGSYLLCKEKSPLAIKAWENLGQAKVALKVNSESELVALEHACIRAGIPCYLVIDAGHTQVEPNSKTVMGIGPVAVSKIDKITGSLKLL